LSALFCGVAILVLRVTRSCREFYEWNAIRLIIPGINWALALQTATLAFDAGRPTVANQWAIAIYMLQATVAPGIFLSTFVVTFLAYRTRSIPFCLVHRGPGRSEAGGTTRAAIDNDEEELQPLVRPATLVVMIRLFALAIFMLTLVVNFDVVWNESDLAGRTGWKTIVENPWSGANAHIFLSLLPMALVSTCCLYFNLLLWCYGSTFSMVIYPCVLNPWIAGIFGTIFLMTGQCFGPDLFPILSNAGILLYQLGLVRVLFEVRHDIRQAGELGNFLTALGDDQVTGGSVAAMEVGTTTGAGSTSYFTKEQLEAEMMEPELPYMMPSLE
jgi:hypothetical protein